MKRPSVEDLEHAVRWLECNEGKGGEAEACKRVAEWVDQLIADRERAAAVRKVAKETGRSPAEVRARLKQMGA